MSYNRKAFFDSVRASFGKLSTDQVKGFEYILARWELEYPKGDHRYLAYALATTWHETDSSMEPIEEYGRGKGHKYGPTGFWGRGYVQLTWDYNYLKASQKLLALYGIKVDLVKNPELAMKPEYAVLILFAGMIEGWFTGRKLSHYFNDKTDDPEEARRIINGVDKKAKIAGHHRSFLKTLKDSWEASAPVPATPVAPKAPEPAPVPPAPIEWGSTTSITHSGVTLEKPAAPERPNLAVSILLALRAWITGKT